MAKKASTRCSITNALPNARAPSAMSPTSPKGNAAFEGNVGADVACVLPRAPVAEPAPRSIDVGGITVKVESDLTDCREARGGFS